MSYEGYSASKLSGPETQVADQLGNARRRGPQHDLIRRADLEQLAAVEDG